MSEVRAHYPIQVSVCVYQRADLGRLLAGRVHDGGPEEVHRRHEEGGQQETGEGPAPPQLGSTGGRLRHNHQQEVRYDRYGLHRLEHGESAV